MIAGQDHLYHSVLSLCLNIGLLEPLEVCQAAVAAYDRGAAPLNSVEGFVRQVLGWREYIRGMYWWDMPEFASRNALGADRPLPDFYWTGDTAMRCLAESIGQTRREAYAHHIQRLMVLGNFALLAGVRPKDISDWFLVVYFDAYEWVELPNVIGMSQFADGGMIASKPYVSGGAYINRMSDYCARCRYDVKRKDRPRRLPVQRALLGFPGPARGAVPPEPAHGDHVRQLGSHARIDPRRVPGECRHLPRPPRAGGGGMGDEPGRRELIARSIVARQLASAGPPC
jgi:deoxyribodipyrimidine photolyase-related protein